MATGFKPYRQHTSTIAVLHAGAEINSGFAQIFARLHNYSNTMKTVGILSNNCYFSNSMIYILYISSLIEVFCE